MSKDTALVVIDFQIGLVEDSYHPDETLKNIQTLLTKARDTATPIIYIQHDGPQGHGLEKGTAKWHIHPAIAPKEQETIIHKESPDAFHETTLQQTLEQWGIKNLVIVGGQTNYCVDTTTRRAISNHYNVTLVSDAHTTSDNDTLTAAQIIAYHNEILDGFWAGAYEVQVKPTAEIAF